MYRKLLRLRPQDCPLQTKASRHIHTHTHKYTRTHTNTRLPVRLSVCLSACLCFCLAVCLSECLPICVSVCLSVCPSVFRECRTPALLGINIPRVQETRTSRNQSPFPLQIAGNPHFWRGRIKQASKSALLSVGLSLCLNVGLSVWERATVEGQRKSDSRGTEKERQ